MLELLQLACQLCCSSVVLWPRHAEQALAVGFIRFLPVGAYNCIQSRLKAHVSFAACMRRRRIASWCFFDACARAFHGRVLQAHVFCWFCNSEQDVSSSAFTALFMKTVSSKKDSLSLPAAFGSSPRICAASRRERRKVRERASDTEELKRSRPARKWPPRAFILLQEPGNAFAAGALPRLSLCLSNAAAV